MLNSKLRKHMLTLSLVSLASMLILLSVIVLHLRDTILKERKDLIHSQVETMLGLVVNVYDDVTKGKLTEQAAKSRLSNYVNSIRYPLNGYFWVLNTQGVMLIHPYQKDTIGKSLLDLQDRNGVHFIQEFIDTAENGGGFVTYDWAKPNENQVERKISYVTLFKPWDWVIGSGLYIEDLNREILDQASLGILVIVGLFLLSIFISLRLSKHYMKEFRHKAIYDSLTRLYTRGYLDEVGPRMAREAEGLPLSVIFFDIDYFKKVNDQYGHDYGDLVLSAASNIIQKELLPHKDVFRYGGEELVAVVYASEEMCRHLSERVRAAIHDHIFQYSEDTSFQITISAGIAVSGHNEAFSDVLRRADRCMYFAKERGRDQVVSQSQVRHNEKR